MGAADYDRLAGTAAILAGIGGFVYSIAFIGGVVFGAAPEAGLLVASAALLFGGILTAVVLIAIHARVNGQAPQLAALGLALALVGRSAHRSMAATTWRTSSSLQSATSWPSTSCRTRSTLAGC